ncbi:hypothetical protein BBJ28_00001004 [Nothophytophthora sp. Chile5]|nr:hypothetical protein BBJ28_00001004 [Nothophytophthora sp. Chile5]
MKPVTVSSSPITPISLVPSGTALFCLATAVGSPFLLLTCLRLLSIASVSNSTYNLKRRAKVAYHGYEAVLNRKKRATLSHSVKPSAVNLLFVSRPAVASTAASALNANAAAALSLQATLSRPQPVVAKPPSKPVLVAAAPSIPRPVAPASVIPSTAIATPTTSQSAAASTARSRPPTPIQQQMQMQQAQIQAMPRRSDFVVGTTVLIQNTADLVACGARNLVGKKGRIVAAPQIYGQELFSVYIDEHEALFQVPFNALTLIGRPAMSQQQQQPQASQQMQQMQAQLAAAAGRLVPNQMLRTPPNAAVSGVQALRASRSAEQVKMEHSFQLHRLMQQQYREIQVLQQRYAECRLVNPTALSGIQKELSKLRLVHLSQVQTLKSKQALDMLGK